MNEGLLLVSLACIIGLWMCWGIGANDLANIMSTALGSKAVSIRTAIIIAIIFELLGAFLGGSRVTDTIRGNIINIHALEHTPHLFIYSMLSVLLAGAVWITCASCLGIPVSITNAIIGAIVGVGSLMFGIHAIHWQTVGWIAVSWVSSPTIAGVVAYLLFSAIKRSILGVANPALAARYYIPLYLLLVGFVLAMMTALKALDHFYPDAKHIVGVLVVILTTIVVYIIGIYMMRHIKRRAKRNRHLQFQYIESLFSVLMGFTACAMVFAHGSNDVAIAVGPISGIISMVYPGYTMHNGFLFLSMMLLGCMGVIAGLLMYGRKVIATVGSHITALTPSRAFAATLAAASTVVVSTGTGIPVSATQTLVGAVFGVGLARGIGALNLAVIRNIFMSWIITIPVAAGLACLFFYLLRLSLG